MKRKHGSSVVSTLACGARGPGFNPLSRQGKISMNEHAFLSDICRDVDRYVAGHFGVDAMGRELGRKVLVPTRDGCPEAVNCNSAYNTKH